MVQIRKEDYYTNLVDYYYDHIHWQSDIPTSIYEWAKGELGADISRYGNYITFSNPADATAFILRWQQ